MSVQDSCDVTAAQALDQMRGVAVGYVLSATQARWFRHARDASVDEQGSELSLDAAYYLRVFNAQVDIEWERLDGDTGLARRVTAPSEKKSRLQRATLLWGTVKDTKTGWAFLDEHRIHGFWVPVDQPPPLGSRLRVAQYERLGHDEVHGNVFVAGTHPVRIEVAP